MPDIWIFSVPPANYFERESTVHLYTFHIISYFVLPNTNNNLKQICSDVRPFRLTYIRPFRPYPTGYRVPVPGKLTQGYPIRYLARRKSGLHNPYPAKRPDYPVHSFWKRSQTSNSYSRYIQHRRHLPLCHGA